MPDWLDMPKRFNFVLDVLERQAASGPDRPALLSLDAGGGVVSRQSYADLCREQNVLFVAELLSWRVQKLILHPGG